MTFCMACVQISYHGYGKTNVSAKPIKTDILFGQITIDSTSLNVTQTQFETLLSAFEAIKENTTYNKIIAYIGDKNEYFTTTE